MRDVAAIILAAGKSTRMNSDLPKVLHPVCGKPMLTYALDACQGAGIQRLLVVVGHQRQLVQAAFGDRPVTWVHQEQQLGTGHAVLMCEQELGGFEGDVVVLAGDMPLVRPETIRDLHRTHRAGGAVLTLGTTQLDDPKGYGRILRDEAGRLTGIVEDVACTPQQREIKEVNPSYYCFDARLLLHTLRRVRPSGAKGEYYITDAVHILVGEGLTCLTRPGLAPEEALGVNSQEDLARVEEVMRRRSRELQPASGSLRR
jgi:bifunctional UDP-N-acetylglucosamine pyrophosphorylase/glucosamine-1-phosphate N-acetyltransferase